MGFGNSSARPVKIQRRGAPAVISVKGLKQASSGISNQSPKRRTRQAEFIRIADIQNHGDTTSFSNKRSHVITPNPPSSPFQISSLISPVLAVPFVIGKHIFSRLFDIIEQSSLPFSRKEPEDLESKMYELSDSLGNYWQSMGSANQQNNFYSMPVQSMTETVKNTIVETLNEEQVLQNTEINVENINGLDDLYPAGIDHTIFSEEEKDLPRLETVYKKPVSTTTKPRKRNPEYMNRQFDFSEMPQVQSKIEDINKTAKRALALEAGMMPLQEMETLFKQHQKVKQELSNEQDRLSAQERYSSLPQVFDYINKYPSSNPGVVYAAGIDEENSNLLDSLAQTSQNISSHIDTLVGGYFTAEQH